MGSALHVDELRTTQYAPASRPVPQVSAIVSVFNKAEWLPACLDSILGQTLRTSRSSASTTHRPMGRPKSSRGTPRWTTAFRSFARRPTAARARAESGHRVRLRAIRAIHGRRRLLPKQALELLHRRAVADGVPVVRGSMAGFHTAEPQRREMLNEAVDRSRSYRWPNVRSGYRGGIRAT